MRLRYGDFENVKYIVDISTKLPRFFRIWHARDFLDNLLVYQRAHQQSVTKVHNTKFVFDIYADFLSMFDINEFCQLTNLSMFSV